MVPPVDATIVWLTEPIVPATTMGTEALLVASAMLVAVMDTVNGVGKLVGARYSPTELTVPVAEVPPLILFTDQVTNELKLPVPETVAEHWLDCPIGTLTILQETATEVIAGGSAAVTVAEPNLVGSFVDVAVIVATPAADGVKTPVLLTNPIVIGLTDHVTEVP